MEFFLHSGKTVVISINSNANHTNAQFPVAMKTTTNTAAFDKLSLTAVISCCCSVLYFLATNLLA